MKTTTYKIATLLIFICGFLANGQSLGINKDAEFSLTVSFFNHAALTSDGTIIYDLKDSVLTISRSALFSETNSILFSKKINSNSIDSIKSIQLDNLQEHYFNYCVLPTSGNEYDISVTINGITKTVALHHYYENQVQKLFSEMNKVVPSKFKIDYLPENTKQDCR